MDNPPILKNPQDISKSQYNCVHVLYVVYTVYIIQSFSLLSHPDDFLIYSGSSNLLFAFLCYQLLNSYLPHDTYK